MLKEKKIMKNKVFILIILFICGIFPSLILYVTSFFNRDNYLELNLEDAYCNDCKMTLNGIEIYGPDPFLVISGLDVELQNVQLVWNENSDLDSVQIFYDEGNGFNESDSLKTHVLTYDGVQKVENEPHIYAIRVDFEPANISQVVDLNTVRLNVHWIVQLTDGFIGMLAIVLIISLCFSWASMKFCTISVKELGALIIGGIGAFIMCFGFLWIEGIGFVLLYACALVCLTVFLSQALYYANEKTALIALSLFVVLILMFWVCLIPYNGSPDEAMRFDIVRYILQYNKIPLGEEIEIRNEIYGVSYAFLPINIYILDALFVKIAMLFTNNFNILIIVARIPNVLLATATTYFVYGIAREKLVGRAKWIFISGVMLLPELLFVFSYVNCDGIAIFSFAWIVYYMLRAEKKKWPLKECLMLGLGIGICLLSYYNAYGVILTTTLYCVISVLKDDSIYNKAGFLMQRILWVLLPAFLYAGWWFIRGAIYHNGDFLGMTTLSKYGEMYATEGFKPSQKPTPNNLGIDLHYMFFDMGWLESSFKSFVACFGWLSIFMSDLFYQIYYSSIFIAIIIGALYVGMNAYPQKRRKLSLLKRSFSRFDAFMFANLCISFGLAVYYSFYSDYQAQGRYFILAVFPLMYLVAKCLNFNINEEEQSRAAVWVQKSVQLVFIFFFVTVFINAFISGVVQCYF